MNLHPLLIVAGAGQIALAFVSPLIPRALGWREQLTRVRPLTRQVFWTYALYILLANLSFGLLSCFGATLLLDGSPLARIVCGFIAAWWIGRVLIQFLYFDRSDAPKGLVYLLAEVALVGLFAFLAVVYTLAAFREP